MKRDSDAGRTYHPLTAENDEEAKISANKLWKEIVEDCTNHKKAAEGPELVEKPRRIEWDPR